MVVVLHLLLAFASATIMALAGIEASIRMVTHEKPGVWAERLYGGVLIVIAMTATGGLGLLLSGARPNENLHFLYALLAFSSIPIAHSFASKTSARGKALATTVGAIIGLVLIYRLFSTA